MFLSIVHTIDILKTIEKSEFFENFKYKNWVVFKSYFWDLLETNFRNKNIFFVISIDENVFFSLTF